MIKFYNIINNYYNYLKLFKINKILIKQIMIYIYYNDKNNNLIKIKFLYDFIL